MVRQYQSGAFQTLAPIKTEAQGKTYMRQKRQWHTFLYKLADFLSAMLAWAGFFLYRKYLEGAALEWNVLSDPNFWYGVLLVPIGWILLYSIFDNYKDIYRLSRFSTFTRTLILSFVGVAFLFFALILDDFVTQNYTYYNSFATLFLLHFTITTTVRMISMILLHKIILIIILSLHFFCYTLLLRQQCA